MEAQVDELLPTRQSLLLRLRNWDDQESWRDFFNTYWKLIYSVAVKAGLNDAAAQDVVQDTIVSLATGLRDGRYSAESGSFKSWLFTITRRRIIDQCRKMNGRVAGSMVSNTSETGALDSIPDPMSDKLDRAWEEDWERNLMDAALNNVKRKVKPLQYQMFDCLLVKQWPVRQVAQTLRVSMHQVYFAKAKISRLVQKEVLRLQKELK